MDILEEMRRQIEEAEKEQIELNAKAEKYGNNNAQINSEVASLLEGYAKTNEELDRRLELQREYLKTLEKLQEELNKVKQILNDTQYRPAPVRTQGSDDKDKRIEELKNKIESIDKKIENLKKNMKANKNEIARLTQEKKRLLEELRKLEQEKEKEKATSKPGTQPGAQPRTQPGAQPTQPGAQPTQPGAQPTQPGAQPTQPGAQPTQPAPETDPNAIVDTQKAFKDILVQQGFGKALLIGILRILGKIKPFKAFCDDRISSILGTGVYRVSPSDTKSKEKDATQEQIKEDAKGISELYGKKDTEKNDVLVAEVVERMDKEFEELNKIKKQKKLEKIAKNEDIQLPDVTKLPEEARIEAIRHYIAAVRVSKQYVQDASEYGLELTPDGERRNIISIADDVGIIGEAKEVGVDISGKPVKEIYEETKKIKDRVDELAERYGIDRGNREYKDYMKEVSEQHKAAQQSAKPTKRESSTLEEHKWIKDRIDNKDAIITPMYSDYYFDVEAESVESGDKRTILQKSQIAEKRVVDEIIETAASLGVVTKDYTGDSKQLEAIFESAKLREKAMNLGIPLKKEDGKTYKTDEELSGNIKKSEEAQAQRQAENGKQQGEQKITEDSENMKIKYVNVIGGGLAGCEAAYQMSKKGIKVKLYEMKPVKYSPAHSNSDLAEIVCSNSFKSNLLTNACGLLKEELRMLDSLLIKIADKTSVPAGQALAVDREKFSKEVTEAIRNDPNIEIINEEITKIPEDEITIIATGPLTSDKLFDEISKMINQEELHFYDAAAPIVEKDSIDMNIAFIGDRYGKGEADYINLPMNKEEYENFWNELVNAEVAQLHKFEKREIFEGCMPVEVMAKRGIDTLRYGPLKPVGFDDPRTGRRPYAIVQLRQDNATGSLYNIVGFQTNLKFGEQKRVFSMIPGLSSAEFVKYGVMHRNTFINSTKLLDTNFQMKEKKNVFFAGQITGVEGYVESIASGLFTAMNVLRYINDEEKLVLPKETMIGALMDYITTPNEKFQPMNANFGILPGLDVKIRDKQERYKKLSEIALNNMQKRII